MTSPLFPERTATPGGAPELDVHYRPGSPTITGDCTSPQWAGAVWSPRFVDISSGAPAVYDTRCAALHFDDGLLIGFRVEDPFPTASLTVRDSLIFSENDIEVFLDFGDFYYEVELNALNTVYEVLHVWRDSYRQLGLADDARFALDGPHAYRFGGDFDRLPSSFWEGTHPRGTRYSFRDFDLPGLTTKVHVVGELNNPAVVSEGWTAELWLPWQGFAELLGDRWLRPDQGLQVRAFLSRFQHLTAGDARVTFAWCCTPHGVADSHLPERYTRLNLQPVDDLGRA